METLDFKRCDYSKCSGGVLSQVEANEAAVFDFKPDAAEHVRSMLYSYKNKRPCSDDCFPPGAYVYFYFF